MEIKTYLYANESGVEKNAHFCMNVDFLILNYRITQMYVPRDSEPCRETWTWAHVGFWTWVLTTMAHFLTLAAVWNLTQNPESQTEDPAQGVAVPNPVPGQASCHCAPTVFHPASPLSPPEFCMSKTHRTLSRQTLTSTKGASLETSGSVWNLPLRWWLKWGIPSISHATHFTECASLVSTDKAHSQKLW